MSIAVITDSTAYLNQALIDKYDIHIVHLNVLFDGVSYEETSELDNDTFYARMRHEKELPTTSQPAMGEYVTLLEKLRDAGVTDVISVHLSSGISGTYQGAITAGSMVDGITVHAFDSEVSCMAQGFYAIRAAEMKRTHSADEIITELLAMRDDSQAYFLVDDLKNLQKGGRLSGAQALIGSMLQIKPILVFEDRLIVPFEKVRTKKKGLLRIEELMHQFAGDSEGTACVIHANDEPAALEWKAKLEQDFPNMKFVLSEFGPVIGTHLGEKALAVGMTKRRLEM